MHCRTCHQDRGRLLPCHFTLACDLPTGGPSAVCFLLHFPSVHTVWPLASTLPFAARTFLRQEPACNEIHRRPRIPLHTLQSFSLANSRIASPQPLPSRRSMGVFHAFLPHRNASGLRFPHATRFSAPMLPPVLFCALPRRRPQGLAPLSSPLSKHGVATMLQPDALLGFAPLQGPPPDRGVRSRTPRRASCAKHKHRCWLSGPASL